MIMSAPFFCGHQHIFNALHLYLDLLGKAGLQSGSRQAFLQSNKLDVVVFD